MRAYAFIFIGVFGLLVSSNVKSDESFAAPNDGKTNAQVFAIKGILQGLDLNDETVTIQHEAVSNFMAAMTMPFKVKNSNELAGLSIGDEISFHLHVVEAESWVDQISKIGVAPPGENKNSAHQQASDARKTPLWFYKFTNELGQDVSLNDFHGQALAVTFIYTRCPLPDACQRLSKNFQEAEQKLEGMTNAPVNWHFISFSFDTDYDTPDVLKKYGEFYNYDPAHWSFLTGPPDKIAELARLSDLKYEFDNGLYDHNFRTLVVDAGGHLQTIFPVSGDLSDSIVAEMIKAANRK